MYGEAAWCGCREERSADAPERRLLSLIHEQDIEVLLPYKNGCRYRSDFFYYVRVWAVSGLEAKRDS